MILDMSNASIKCKSLTKKKKKKQLRGHITSLFDEAYGPRGI